ncbi:hypothetical protein B0T24DRAFT_536995 [Lasiosphaeria ovina]|uniref:Uncharacterized protein n=1 Tax=Lasiosphaeria ovina TaxID=92902 RepID=A0AAE0JWC1_9PEZI|nr:hypothetical protein B0T24DRAFT_536995 [Lasiosphaeria ovina]
MPSRANSTSVKPAGTVSVKRFELPALEFKFASLTEGTDIPAPLPSPVLAAVPTPPETPKEQKKATSIVKKATDTGPSPAKSTTSSGGTKRPAEDNPSSPTLSSRPGSIRRLFSRNLLNNAYANGEDGATTVEPSAARPPSRSNSTLADPRKMKRTSGWFSRLRSSDSAANKRNGVTVTSTPVIDEKKATGPPPPMIPELSELKSKVDVQNEGHFGSDLFKNIN